MSSATNELWSIFDARRVKAPELRGLDAFVNSFVGWFKNRRPVLSRLKVQTKRITALEPEIHNLGATHVRLHPYSGIQLLTDISHVPGAKGCHVRLHDLRALSPRTIQRAMH